MHSRRHGSGRPPGRPLLGSEPYDCRVTTLVTAATKARILARPEGESAFVRRAIAAYFARGKKAAPGGKQGRKGIRGRGRKHPVRFK